MPNILALDISSTAIGWCWLEQNGTPLAKSIALGAKTDIAARCAKAQAEVALLLAAWATAETLVVVFLALIASAKALALRVLTRDAGIPFVINDHVDMALAAGADGVHVGQADMPAPFVRQLPHA